MEVMRIQGELVRCDVMAGKGQKEAASYGLALAKRCWAALARRLDGGIGVAVNNWWAIRVLVDAFPRLPLCACETGWLRPEVGEVGRV